MGLVVRGLHLRDLEVALDAVALYLDGADPELADNMRVEALGGGLRGQTIRVPLSFGILSFHAAASVPEL